MKLDCIHHVAIIVSNYQAALEFYRDKLGLPLYLAAVLVFGTRLFQNFAEIRRELLTSRPKGAKIEQDIVQE